MTQDEWKRRYVAYMNHLGWPASELELMAQVGWECWPEDDPEEIASSDLHCMRGDGG